MVITEVKKMCFLFGVWYMTYSIPQGKARRKAGWRTVNTLNFEKVISFPLCPHPCLENFKTEEIKKALN